MKKLRNYDSAPGCSMEAALHIIGAKWKGVILYHLFKDGTLRFSELQRHLKGINQRLLTRQLRELEEDGIVNRQVYAVMPPKVEYSLSDEGRALQPMIMGLSIWGRQWLEKRGMKTAEDENIEEIDNVDISDEKA
ncbi:helix-turn-helix transcriptional regulator [Citrobacter freundii]|uniref:winged helix-turn-helix transcriptional regulator n=1 Tax=Citrobacter TaxID=544 RepID=UPI00214DB149|nr:MULTISPECIES: helix-turn-helix domain-containing protein [Citrobacter]MCR3713740.1 helix-turn-helix transcriptional regulator [Citrobacter freundii]MDM3231792.1 helix-turn-helix transcriptional regulator [Citrobacter sp. Cf078]